MKDVDVGKNRGMQVDNSNLAYLITQPKRETSIKCDQFLK